MSNMRWWNEGMKLISAYDRWQNAACKHTNQLSFGNLVKFGIISNNGGPNKSTFHSLTVTKTPRFQSEWHLQSPNSSFWIFFDLKPWRLGALLLFLRIRDSGFSSAASKCWRSIHLHHHPFGVPTNSQGEQKLGRLNIPSPFFCYTNKHNSWSKVGKNQSQHPFFIKKSCKPSIQFIQFFIKKNQSQHPIFPQ